jgi:DNA-binding NtrC family response regulator
VVETLAGLGYAPVGFTSAAAAFEVFAADPARFDAVVTDESMPGLSGSDMIRGIRAIRPAMPTLVVSGYLSAAIMRRAREAGADEVLKKPISADALGTSLDRILHPRKSARRAAAASARAHGPDRITPRG